jgi:hypothetical protein
MGPPPSLQHAAEWQTWVQIPPHLQLCADGATTFSSTCSRVADVGANPSLPAAVCRWCHHLLFNTAPSQRRHDTPLEPEVSLSGSRPSPADQWHSLRACLCEPEPGSPRRLHAVLPPHLHTLALAQCILQGPLLTSVLSRCRPLLQSSLHLREDADWGGLLWRIVYVVVKYIHS